MGSDAVDATLRAMWRDLRDTGDDRYVRGAIALAFAIGMLTPDQRELWERRIATCPGHEDEGGRAWCAYCGDMPGEDDHAAK